MYNKAQLFYIIQNNAYRWNEFRCKHQNKTLDLSGLDFRGCVVCQLDLSNVDLSGANFSSVDLTGTELRNSNLSGADLSGANLTKAKCHNTNFTSAIFTSAILTGADMYRANFDSADMRKADMSKANFLKVSMVKTQLQRCDLSGSCVSGTNLNVADLSGANLSGVNILGSTLQETDYSNTLLEPLFRGEIVCINETLHYPIFDPRGFILCLYMRNNPPLYMAGCRMFTRLEALNHWDPTTYAGSASLAAEYCRAIKAMHGYYKNNFVY